MNREAVVLEWASRCFKTSACIPVPERKTADEPTPKAGDKSSHGAGDRTPGDSTVKPATGAAHKERESSSKRSKGSGRAGADIDADSEREHALAMKQQEKEAQALHDQIKAAKERLALGKKIMSDAEFEAGIAAANASYDREQEMRIERAKGAAEKAHLIKELARISAELAEMNGPPRQDDRSEGHRERSMPRQGDRSEGHRESVGTPARQHRESVETPARQPRVTTRAAVVCSTLPANTFTSVFTAEANTLSRIAPRRQRRQQLLNRIACEGNKNSGAISLLSARRGILLV